MSYELFLFRPRVGGAPRAGTMAPSSNEAVAPLDENAIGQFLLEMGPAIRFTADTPLGDHYVYEDEAGSTIEIVVGSQQVALGFPNWTRDPQGERAKRVLHALALAMVARFGLTLYDPQTKRFIRASETSQNSDS